MMARKTTVWGLPFIVAFSVACGDEPTDLPNPDGGVLDGGSGDAGTLDTGPTDTGPIDTGIDLTEAVFAPDHLIEVDIQLDAADWEILRNQARTFADLFGNTSCVDAPPTSPYVYFPASVVIDGESFNDVGVRKKGFFGSVNPVKPSLKLKFDEFVDDQEFSGFDRMTFNNGRQGNDRSTVHQCIGYNLFAAAGIASPRCNHARVSVNGQSLGVFVHVENIKKRFLRRHFDDDEGALYEGALSDFRPVWIDTFERKTNSSIMDRSDLAAVAAALELDDSELLPALGELVDIDEFITFWAMEVLIQHWDGYNSFNNNNFFIYKNPDTGRFHFFPWGIDAILGFGPEDQGQVVFLSSLLSRRIHEHPETAAQFYVRLEELINNVWNEQDILADVQATEDMVRPHIAPENLDLFNQSLVSLRDFVQRRRGEVEAMINGTPPDLVPIREPLCLQQAGDISGTFSGNWGTFPAQNPFGFGDGTLTATIAGQVFVGQNVSTIAGLNEDGLAIVQVAAQFPDRSIGAIFIFMPPEKVVAGTTVPLELQSPEGGGVVVYIPQPGQPVQTVGNVSGGQITFTEASTVDGAPIVGTYSGPIFENL